MNLIPSPVCTADEVEAMRVIFNECLEFMTKPLSPITHAQQHAWWNHELPKKVKKFKAFVYRDNEEIVAYSLLQWHFDGRITPIFGIKKSARGMGLSRRIIQHYLSEADGPLYGEELSSHAAIIKLNREAGWELIREENGVRYLYHLNNKTTYPDYQSMFEYWSK